MVDPVTGQLPRDAVPLAGEGGVYASLHEMARLWTWRRRVQHVALKAATNVSFTVAYD